MLRLVFSPRWIGWHLLTLGAMAACVWASLWQWDVAGSALGSAQNIGYGLQWPVFAVFFAFMWWRFLRLELAQLAGQGKQGKAGEPPATASSGTASPEPTPPDTALGDDLPAPGEPAVAEEPPAAVPAAPAPWESGPSPFTRTPAWSAGRETAGSVIDEEASPALAEYNRLLAELAARDRAEQQG